MQAGIQHAMETTEPFNDKYALLRACNDAAVDDAARARGDGHGEQEATSHHHTPQRNSSTQII